MHLSNILSPNLSVSSFVGGGGVAVASTSAAAAKRRKYPTSLVLLYKAAATSLRALNALLTALLACRRRRAVTLCDHCDPWVELHNGKTSSEVFEEGGLDVLEDEPDPT